MPSKSISLLPTRAFRIDSDFVLALTLMAVLLSLGLCLHSAPFTPDEPREYDIALNMLHQPDKAVPLLAGEPFCEKPPLTYWAAATSMSLFGPSVWAARLPNLLWSTLTLICLLSWIASVVPKPLCNRALVFTALTAGSMLLLLRVHLWLATDSPLVAMTAIALLGAWRGLQADSRKQRLLGYSLMHLGLCGAFFAKNAFGWLTPVLALAGMIIWERRWRELLRFELYVGLLPQLLLIGTWLWFVAEYPVTGNQDGAQLLRIFLIDNTLGRLLPMATAEQYQYGHRNYIGKYFFELPYYLLPWTFAALAALRWAYKTLRFRAVAENAIARVQSSAIRFAILTLLLGLLALSFANTARDVYVAPELLGFAMLLGLWFGIGVNIDSNIDIRANTAPNAAKRRFDRICLRLTHIIAIGLGVLLAILSFGVPLLQGQLKTSWLAIAAAIAAIALTTHAVNRWRAQWPLLAGTFKAWGVFACGVIFANCLLLPSFDRSQDMRPLVNMMTTQYRNRSIGVLRADETMRAYLDFGGGVRAANFRSLDAAENWLQADATHVLVIELSTDHVTPIARARLQSWHSSWSKLAPRDENKSAWSLATHGFKLLSKHEVIGGRTYGVWAKA